MRIQVFMYARKALPKRSRRCRCPKGPRLRIVSSLSDIEAPQQRALGLE